MLELAIAAMITTLLVVWAAQALMNRLKDHQAQAAAAWMSVIHKGVLSYIQQHGVAMQEANDSDALASRGVADWRAPTLAELKALGLLSMSTPEESTLLGPARVSVWARGTCPGDACKIEALVYGETPITQAKGSAVDEGVVAQWLLAAEGKGGAVHPSDPSYIRGASFRLSSEVADAQPLPPGTVGMSVTAEHLALWSYLRVRDRRDPDFQGGLTVQKDISAGEDARVGGQIHVSSAASIGGPLTVDLDAHIAGSAVVSQHADVGGRIRIGAEHTEDTVCAPDKGVAHDVAGGLLVCRNGLWRSASRGGGGGFGYNQIYGCRFRDGTATHNPVTGACSCPTYATAVPIFDSGPQSPPEGRQYAYLCVG